MDNHLPAAILFDMDDTILDDTSGGPACWQEACNHNSAQLKQIMPEQLCDSILKQASWFWSDVERHRIGRLDLTQARREIAIGAFRQHGIEDFTIAHAIADFYTAKREQLIQPFAGALDTLQHLKDQNIRLVLITNGNGEAQRRKIDRFNLQRFFESILIEGEFGVGKPDERIYRHALTQLDLPPSAVWMVGDNLEWDVGAPQRLGISGIWNDFKASGLSPSATVRPDRIIQAITELVM
ncbi:MAG: HAD family hydrolase [Chloroflexota bacterium]|nr:HAD family hydrolase [Anaerolineae bacterium]